MNLNVASNVIVPRRKLAAFGDIGSISDSDDIRNRIGGFHRGIRPADTGLLTPDSRDVRD